MRILLHEQQLLLAPRLSAGQAHKTDLLQRVGVCSMVKPRAVVLVGWGALGVWLGGVYIVDLPMTTMGTVSRGER